MFIFVLVRNVATLIFPSFPGWTSVTRANGHVVGGTLSSLISTNVPGSITCPSLTHFERGWSCWRYSWCHLLQKWRFSCCIRRQWVSLFSGMIVVSASGTCCRCDPTKKWPGVRAVASDGSSVIGVRGREFRQHSISANSVVISSKDRVVFPRTRTKWCFIERTAASQIPPKWGARGGMNFQLICLSNVQLCMPCWCSGVCSSLYSSFSWLLAPLKFVALSECNSSGSPRRATKRRNADKNASVVRSDTSSMWIARVVKQTNIAT